MLKQIAGGTGAGVALRAGQFLTVVDIEGGQICDLMAYTPDGADRLNSGLSGRIGARNCSQLSPMMLASMIFCTPPAAWRCTGLNMATKGIMPIARKT